MNACENPLPVKCSRVSSRLCFLAVVILMSPAITPLQNIHAAIDETMPDTIPTEIIVDWQDQGGTIESIKAALIEDGYEEYAEKITGTGDQGYLSARHWNRVARMKPFEAELENIMFCRHHNFGGLHPGYHDNTQQNSSDLEWSSKSALCVLNMENYYSAYTELLAKTDAVVRDPCISFDGTKVLFAISGPEKGTGYKVFEMEIDDPGTLKQLTEDPDGMVVADFEPCYLPDGDIMFTSTRNFGSLGCDRTPTTNMFLMNGEGNYIRQVGFDQAHTFYPVLIDEGMVLYTRWEFNDRNVTNSMGLFVMNPDGSRQMEWFGIQTSWPMTIIQARPIPDTYKIMAIASGHHAPYSGELMIIDPYVGKNGFNGTECIEMLAPRREAEPDVKKGDIASGDVYFTFQTPFPLSEKHFLVSWRPSESEDYRLYFMDADGNRELLAWADQSVSQPVIIKAREPMPPQIRNQVDYSDSIGCFTMYNVYYGDGTEGIERGTAKTLRVVKLHYRVAGCGDDFGVTIGDGPSDTFIPGLFCPVSAYGASWEAKEVLGEAKIYEDGSAAFKVPARTPVYFQVLDSSGYCIATMRSWSTLMPGEYFACIGCHENKNIAPPMSSLPMADEPEELETPLGIENQPFDYGKMVQPIFDEHCVSCHTADHESGFDLSGTLEYVTDTKKYWTISYVSLLNGIGAESSNDAVNICTMFSPTEQQPPYSFGSSLSGIMTTGGMSGNHHDVQVTETERKIVACWIDLCAPHAGRYDSYMKEEDSTAYEMLLDKKERWATIEKENIRTMLDPSAAAIPHDHGNVKAISSLAERFMEYVPARRALILKTASRGNFILVDLRGKVITGMQLSEQLPEGNIIISLPASLSTGFYVARFEGGDGIRQTTVFIAE